MLTPLAHRVGAIATIALSLTGGLLSAAPDDKPSLTCTADRSRSVRIKGGDWDDKTEKIQFDLAIRNNSMSKPTGDLSATFFVIGEDAGERNKFKLLQKEEMTRTPSSARNTAAGCCRCATTRAKLCPRPPVHPSFARRPTSKTWTWAITSASPANPREKTKSGVPA